MYRTPPPPVLWRLAPECDTYRTHRVRGSRMSDTADRRGRGVNRGLGAAHAAAGRIAALEKVVEQYKVLLETSAAITAGTDLVEILGLITRLVSERLDVAWCRLFDYEAAADEFVVIAFYQLPELEIDSSEWVGTRYHAENWRDIAACVRDKRPSICYRDDASLTAEELADMDHWGELSSVSLPLIYKDEVIGLIDVGESRKMRRWTEDDKRVLKAIADQAAIAIVNARAYTRLAEQAITDGLTGLFNHRHFNERFGHPQGDRVLAEVAEIFRHCTRTDVDILARYGGDEFMVILPQTRASGSEPTAARNVAERIAAAIRAHRFESAKGRRDVAMTVSIGVAGIGLGGYTHEELLSSADKALYLAEHQGKDRVSVFGT